MTTKPTPTKTRAARAKAQPPVATTSEPVPKISPKTTDMVGRIVELIEWVDNPFKLFTVILLSFMFFAGYFAWDSRQVILQAITSGNHKSELKETPALVQVATNVQRDLEAETVVVYKASLVVNSRITLFSLTSKGQDKTLDGTNSTLFSKDAQRNQAMIAMLGGEVQCDKLVVTGKSSDWEEKQGVTFVCRGGIPPQMGEFDGYVSVGFKSAPDDLTEVKTRINLATTEMSK